MPEKDYKKLYSEAVSYLRYVLGSRNSFAPEANTVLFGGDSSVQVRTPEVEALHREAAVWLQAQDQP